MGTQEKRKVTEVSFKDQIVTIRYEEPHDEDMVESTVTSEDEPRKSFFLALNKLAPHAVGMCEIDPEWGRSVAVRKLKLKYVDDERYGVTIVCAKQLTTGQTLNFQTPHTPRTAASAGAPELAGEVIRAIAKLVAEALKYLDGERAQGKLFNETEIK